MTNYEFFESVSKGIVNDEVIAHAEEQMANIEANRIKQAEKRKSKADENRPLKKEIFEFIETHHSGIASEVANGLSTTDRTITTGKASSMLRQMATDGLLTVSEVKSPTSKSKVKQYMIASGAVWED